MVAVPAVPTPPPSCIEAALTQFVHDADRVDAAAVKGWFVISILLNLEALPETGVKEYVDVTEVAEAPVLESVLEYPVMAPCPRTP